MLFSSKLAVGSSAIIKCLFSPRALAILNLTFSPPDKNSWYSKGALNTFLKLLFKVSSLEFSL